MKDSIFDIVITATGRCIPERILSNEDLKELCGHSSEWIIERTGVVERHLAAPDQTTSQLAASAARQACERAGVDPVDIGLIVVASVTGETHFPTTACWLQAALGNSSAFVFDVTVGCAGFVYALSIAQSLLESDMACNALVVGADRVTGITDYTDPRSCILFGDGAGAVLLERRAAGATQPRQGLLASQLFADGSKAGLLFRPLDANASPDHPAHASSGSAFMHMEGRSVYQHAVRCMESAVGSVLDKAGMLLSEIDWIIPHQANARIIDALTERLGVAAARVYSNIARYGNTSAASIPICLDEMNQLGLLQRGQRILMCSFGTGFTWGATVLSWV
ncbi:ketoacyl-ACP synthase III [bacterium]|nr:ketoacyl-ACP synthase III [bacterium]